MRSCSFVLTLAIGFLLAGQSLPAQFPLVQTFAEPVSGSHIGVGLRDIDADRAAALKLGSVTGVLVMTVVPASPAEQAGIKAGDVLLSYNGESIIGAQQLGRLVSETPVGRKVKIEYFRDGKVTTVMVTTSARPSGGAITFNNVNTLLDAGGDSWPMPVPVPSPLFSWMNPQLGIECESLDARNSQLAEFFGVKRGVLVRSVSKESAAAKAGVRAGDVILQIAGHTVADPKEIAYYLREEPRGAKPLPLEVMRDHRPFSLKLNVADPQE
jgi:serine protease Do